jgi:hypothetical protein
MGCESPNFFSVVLKDTLAFGLDSNGQPDVDLYQNTGRGQPVVHLTEDSAQNQHLIFTDSKDKGAGSSAELMPGAFTQIPARNQFIEVSGGGTAPTPTAGQVLARTHQFGTAALSADMIANMFTGNGPGAAKLTCPFLSDFDNLKATKGTPFYFGAVYLGWIDSSAGGFPSVSISLTDSKDGSTVSQVTYAPTANWVTGVLDCFHLTYADFFGGGQSTATAYKGQPMNLIITLTWSGEEKPAFVGTVLVGTDQRALVP